MTPTDPSTPDSATLGALCSMTDDATLEMAEIEAITPSNAELLRLAERCPPPAE